MTSYDYDLVVLGAGSGGVRAARMSAAEGARVAICEERYLGGTCVNVGCVPKKLLVYASEYREELEDAHAYGWHLGGDPRFSWKELIEHKNREIERLNGVYGRLLHNSGVELIEDRARLVDPHTVEVGGRRVTSEHILVATGSWPRKPTIPGAEHVITSNEAFYLDDLPERIVVVGGGYIGVEFASIFNGMGARVTMVYRQPQLLRGFDEDLRYVLGEEMEKKGVELCPARTLERIDREGDTYRCTLSDGRALEADLVLCAIGRDPNTAGIGVEELGLELGDDGEILVDDHYRTNVPSVLAIGDVIARYPLTPVAIHEGMAVAKTLFGGEPTTVDYRNVPSTVFSQPNVGTVGLSESQAHYECGEHEVYRTTFRPMKHTLTGRNETTLMKLVVEPDTDRVLGCHMVGPHAGETIQGFAVALNAGATKAMFDRTIGIHPTSAEEMVTMRTPVSPHEREAAE